MGYGCYEIGGMLRGYMVDDVCHYPGCEAKIDRGLAYLCYGCDLYFCEKHLSYEFCKHDEPLEFDSSFAGRSSQACPRCCGEAEAGEIVDCNCPEGTPIVYEREGR